MKTRPRGRRLSAIVLLGIAGCGDTPQTGQQAAPLPPDYVEKQKEIMDAYLSGKVAAEAAKAAEDAKAAEAAEAAKAAEATEAAEDEP